MKKYYVYILTNPGRKVLYVGFTSRLCKRVWTHYCNKGIKNTFAGRYFTYLLIYYETFTNPMEGIRREKEIKKWRRGKKENLIHTKNPDWHVLDFPDF